MSYFSNSEETGFDDLVDLDIEIVQSSSYNEEDLKTKIEKSQMKRELFACAVQLALVGWGRRTYGDVNISGTKKDLTDIFDEAGVLYSNEAGTNLKPDDLTPKRLVRVFRFQIQKYIIKRQSKSFLLKKYGYNNTSEFNPYIFPGCEHLITNKKHAIVLLECYASLDKIQGTHFVDRVKTVFRTRNVEYI